MRRNTRRPYPFAGIPHWVIDTPGLSGNALRLYLVLRARTRHNAQGIPEHAFSVNALRLAERRPELGSNAWISEGLKELVKLGLLRRILGGRGRPGIYEFVLEPPKDFKGEKGMCYRDDKHRDGGYTPVLPDGAKMSKPEVDEIEDTWPDDMDAPQAEVPTDPWGGMKTFTERPKIQDVEMPSPRGETLEEIRHEEPPEAVSAEELTTPVNELTTALMQKMADNKRPLLYGHAQEVALASAGLLRKGWSVRDLVEHMTSRVTPRINVPHLFLCKTVVPQLEQQDAPQVRTEKKRQRDDELTVGLENYSLHGDLPRTDRKRPQSAPILPKAGAASGLSQQALKLLQRP